MTVTTTNYTAGGGTKLITVSNEFGTKSANIINAVDAAIISLGWTSYDTIDATLFSPIVTEVYRVLNADGITYKYLIIRWDTVKLFFYTSTCEFWNLGSHTPTNESWTQAGGFAQGYDVASCYFILSASARHFMIWPFINRQPGLWTAVIEFERIAAEDLATVATTPTPCWAWTSSVMIGSPWGLAQTSAGPSRVMFAFPRLVDGTVGASAAYYYAPITNKGMMPPFMPQTTITIAGDVVAGHIGSYYRYLGYGWDFSGTSGGLTGGSFRAPTSPFSVDRIDQYTPFGRAYNFGILGSSIGQPGDTVYANVDTTGGWPSGNTTTSTNTECLTLPINGGLESFTQALIPPYTSGSFNLQMGLGYTSTASYTYATAAGKVIGIGDQMWSVNSYGVHTTPISGGAIGASYSSSTTNFALQRAGSGLALVFQDILFDGNRTVWASTANGIVGVDTITYSATYYTSANTVANGCSYLGIDNKNIYAANRTGLSNPSIAVFDRNSLTFQSNVLSHAGTAMGTSTNYGTPVPDYKGNVFAAIQSASQSATITYSTLFNANTAIRTNIANPRGSALAYGGDAFHYDYITDRVWLIYSTPGSNQHNQLEYWPGNLVARGTALSLTSGLTYSITNAGTNAFPSNGTTDFKGDIYIIPYKGMHFIGPRRPGLGSAATNTFGFATTFIHPAVTANTVPSGQFIANPPAAITTGVFAHPFQSGSGLTTNGSQLFSGYFNINTWNIVMTINGIYGTTTSNAQPTSRLIVKG